MPVIFSEALARSRLMRIKEELPKTLRDTQILSRLIDNVLARSILDENHNTVFIFSL
jgi:hypothetical protein